MNKFLLLSFLFSGMVFAQNSFRDTNLSQFSLEKILGADLLAFDEDDVEPMPPGPYPNPEPVRERILCLSVGTQNYGQNILFYGFGQNGNMAARRSQTKCMNFGFYNCRIWWCNPVF